MNNTVSKLLSAARGALGIQHRGSPTFRRVRAEVKRSLGAGNPHAAIQILGPFLAYPPRPELGSPSVWHDTLALFAQIVEALGVDAGVNTVSEEADAGALVNGLAALMRRSAVEPDDVDTLRMLARAMSRVSAAGIGAMLLARAARLAPDDGDLLADLALALLDNRLYNDAVGRLQRAPDLLDRPHRARYALAWAYLHLGQLEDARTQWALALPPAEEADQRPFHTIDGILQRCAACNLVTELSQHDLRGWNFAFNGSYLLHRSSFGGDQMNGRYAFVHDSDALCMEGILRLVAVLDACNLSVRLVYFTPEYESAVLAMAAARYLGCECMEWPEAGSEEAGLIVIYDSDIIDREVLETMVDHHPGQFIWVHAQTWMRDIPVGPDFITYLHETNISPWATSDDPFLPQDEPEAASIADAARRILEAGLAADALADLPDLCRWVGELPALPEEHAAGALRTQGTRRVFFADSPVHSNSFHFHDIPVGRLNEEDLLRDARRRLQAGQEADQIVHAMIGLGVDGARAQSLGAMATASFQSQRADAVTNHLLHGVTAMLAGIVLAFAGYSFGSGFFLMALIAGAYGTYNLLAALAIRSTRTISSVDVLRTASCVALILIGIWLLFTAEWFVFDELTEIVFQLRYWLMILSGYALLLTGVWGLIDRSVFRPRTGDPDLDAPTHNELAQLGALCLVVLLLGVGHILAGHYLLPILRAPVPPISPLIQPDSPPETSSPAR